MPMNINKPFNLIQAGVLILALIVMCGCTSTNKSKPNNDIVDNERYVQISAQELQQLQTSSAQWQAIKPDIERLLLIESDLNLLITQLTAIANEDKSETSALTPSIATSQSAPESSASTAMSDVAKKALFALQIISVTQQSKLSTSWQAIQKKAPSLLSDEFATNVETAKVKGTTYYRLKLGAYQYQKNAQTDCDKLKQQQVSCIVSHYTDNPIKL